MGRLLPRCDTKRDQPLERSVIAGASEGVRELDVEQMRPCEPQPGPRGAEADDRLFWRWGPAFRAGPHHEGGLLVDDLEVVAHARHPGRRPRGADRLVVLRPGRD